MNNIIKSLLAIAAVSLFVISNVEAKKSKRVSQRVMGPMQGPWSLQMTQEEANRVMREASQAIIDPNVAPENKVAAGEELKMAVAYTPETLKYAQLLEDIRIKEEAIKGQEKIIADLKEKGGFGWGLFDSAELKKQKRDAERVLTQLRDELKPLKEQLPGQVKIVGRSRARLVAMGVGALTALGMAYGYATGKISNPLGR